eukprot:10815774-Lingulodinium_polyedra.AAC.1
MQQTVTYDNQPQPAATGNNRQQPTTDVKPATSRGAANYEWQPVPTPTAVARRNRPRHSTITN